MTTNERLQHWRVVWSKSRIWCRFSIFNFKINLQNYECKTMVCALWVLCSFQMCCFGGWSRVRSVSLCMLGNIWRAHGSQHNLSLRDSQCQWPSQSPVKTLCVPAAWYTPILPQWLLSVLKHHTFIGSGLHILNSWVVPLGLKAANPCSVQWLKHVAPRTVIYSYRERRWCERAMWTFLQCWWICF